jgi:hypothetical protein
VTRVSSEILKDYEAGKIVPETFDRLFKHEASHSFFTPTLEQKLSVPEIGAHWEELRYGTGNVFGWSDLYGRKN